MMYYVTLKLLYQWKYFLKIIKRSDVTEVSLTLQTAASGTPLVLLILEQHPKFVINFRTGDK